MTKLERFAQLDGMLQTSQAIARGIVKEYMLSLEKVLTNQIFVR